MTYSVQKETEEFAYIKCPFPDITGFDCMFIVKGYCTVGRYCAQDCTYAWSVNKENI